jgi:D-3-phosphoglycerate dehydrogenase
MTEKPSVLITAREVHPLIPLRLKEMGFDVMEMPEPAEEELLQAITNITGIIFTTYTRIDKSLLDKATRLKFIGRVGSGLENVDLEYAEKKGIAVFSSPEGNANAVGEHTLGLLLNLMNHICKANSELQRGIWQREANRGQELDGKVVGIVGYGHTGSAFARKLRGFDCVVLAYDKYKSGFGNNQVQESNIATIVEKADIISFHVPYSEETHHLMNESFFSSLKRQPFILHTCRGAVMDTVAALSALENKLISGLGIDVFEDEPFTMAKNVSEEVYWKLLRHDRVVATPHIAGWTAESKLKLATILMDKIADFYEREISYKACF